MTVPEGATGYSPIPSFADWVSESVDTTDFDRYAKIFAQTKASSTDDMLATAMETARRYAAVDTNAIEGIYEVDRGFTRTVATQAAAWEAIMAARGPHVRPAFDDALNGYEYVLDAATQKVEITEKWIKEIHQIICGSQDTYKVYTPSGPQEHPLPKGQYKTMPNSPTLLDGRLHAYAPVADTVPEMGRLTTELRSDKFLNSHPIMQAAYAHYAYVCIHPFADGNGRVARALSSVFLYRQPGIPLIVFADERNRYYDALEQADGGNPAAFIRFVATQAIDTINLISVLLRNTAPSVAETLTSLKDLFDTGARESELLPAAARVRSMAIAEVKNRIKSLDLPDGLSMQVSTGRFLPDPKIPTGYVDIGPSGSWGIIADAAYPRVNVFLPISTCLRVASPALSDLLIVSARDDGLEVWIREVDPEATETFKLKLSAWVEARIAEMLLRVKSNIEKRR